MNLGFTTVSVLVAVALCGCGSTSAFVQKSRVATVDLAYAQTTAGFINSGLQGFGSLYLLDSTLGKERVDKLDVIDFKNASRGQTYERYVTQITAPASISGEINAGIKASVTAGLKNEAKLELQNSTPVEALRTFNELSALLNEDSAKGSGNLAADWSLPEAAQPGSPLRLLLIYASNNADSASFSVAAGPSGTASLTLPNAQGGSVKVNLEGTDLSQITGKQVPVLHKYRVIKVSLKDNGKGAVTYNFEIDRSFDLTRLPSILKGSTL